MAYDSTKPANDGYLAEFPAEMRENERALVNDKIVNAGKLNGLSSGNENGNIPISNGTLCTNLNAEKLGGNLASFFSPSTHTHAVVTTSSNGLMSNTDKVKLDGIATGAEINQNAFSNILVGTTTIQADGKSDTLEIVAGTNISITPDAINDRVTISLNGTVISAGNSNTVGGFAVSNGINTTANQVMRTDQNGYSNFGYINSNVATEDSSTLSRCFYESENDGFIRKCTPARFKSLLELDNVSNTSDSAKSVNYANSSGTASKDALGNVINSTYATKTEVSVKANTASPTFTGTSTMENAVVTSKLTIPGGTIAIV